MNRTLRLSVMLFFILCLAACAQDSQRGQASRSPEWKPLRSGVEIIRMWELVKDLKFPQVAILRFSSESEHSEFARDPKKYLQDHNVFGNDPRTNKPYQLKKIISRVDLSEDELQLKETQSRPQGKTSDPWYVVAEHNAYCDSAIIEASVDY